MLRAIHARESQQMAGAAWQRQRLAEAMAAGEEDDEDDEEPEHLPGGEGEPRPDDFAPCGQRLPKGHAVATAHAEAVLIDRVRALLDSHYDEVFAKDWAARQDATLAASDSNSRAVLACSPFLREDLVIVRVQERSRTIKEHRFGVGRCNGVAFR